MASGKRTEDESWVASCLAGNRKAFDNLVNKYRDAVYGVAYYYVADFAQAKDLVQDAFIQAYVNLPRLREPRKFGSWLYGIASNLSKTWLKDARRNVSLEEVERSGSIKDGSAEPSKIFEREELKRQVKRALDALTENSRLAITLYYIDGYSYREIADFLDVPVTTVEGRLHRARRRLKKELLPMVEKDFRRHSLPDDYANSLAQYVRDLRRQSSWKTRLKAFQALREAGIDAEKALLQGMKDKDWHVRRWCCFISRDVLGSKVLVDGLIALLDDSNKRVRIHAMHALCSNCDRIGQDLVPIIVAKLKDRNQYVRRWAALALGYFFRDKRAVQPLLQKLDDESQIVRRWAAESLRRITAPLER
jgi:RNA polymerase sigma-70 factor (ECF subfamily)